MRPNSVRDRHARYWRTTAVPQTVPMTDSAMPSMRPLPEPGPWPDDDGLGDLLEQAQAWAAFWRRAALASGAVAAAAIAALLW